jgi:uncharacterized protein (UPF0264 family)
MHLNSTPTPPATFSPATTHLAPRQWLVSVRDQQEAQLAAHFGVDVLDLKEPERGPLAPTDPRTWQDVADWAASWEGPSRVSATRQAGFETVPKSPASPPPLSAALGERPQALGLAAFVPATFAFAKAGPQGCSHATLLRGLWQSLRERLPAPVELVAVAYADHTHADCLPPREILPLAANFGLRRVLIDTFDKSAGSSVQRLGSAGVHDLATLARRHRLWCALAGSLKLAEARQLWRSARSPAELPHCLAVRGDVCRGDRRGTLSADRLDAWARWLAEPAAGGCIRPGVL